MRYLIYGGSGSGKSYLAEQLLDSCQDKIYIATMWPAGQDAARRIAKHQAMRKDKGFATRERYTDLAGLVLEAPGGILLECLGNLVANEMFSAQGAGAHTREAVWQGLAHLWRQDCDVVIVSNDVGGDGVEYDPETQAYQQTLAALNRDIASQCQVVVEMVYGIPLVLKGEL